MERRSTRTRGRSRNDLVLEVKFDEVAAVEGTTGSGGGEVVLVWGGGLGVRFLMVKLRIF